MMATATTDSTFNLRHRLVGAFILIALAVFVLPMVLRGASTGEKTVTVDIATPSEKRQPKEFTSRVTPVGEGAAKVVQETGENGSKIVSFEDSKTPEQAPAPTAPQTAQTGSQIAAPTTPAVVVVPAPQPEPTAQPLSVQVEPQPLKPGEVVIASTAPAVEAPPAPVPEVKVAPPAPKPKAAPKPKPKTKTGNVPDSSLNVTTDRGWVVRVGTFGQPSNARTMARLLQSKGFAPRSTKEKTKEGLTMTRVWVGPFPERVTAGRVLEKILKQTGEKGFISPYP